MMADELNSVGRHEELTTTPAIFMSFLLTQVSPLWSERTVEAGDAGAIGLSRISNIVHAGFSRLGHVTKEPVLRQEQDHSFVALTRRRLWPVRLIRCIVKGVGEDIRSARAVCRQDLAANDRPSAAAVFFENLK
jgi:hypothetical protein